ncbi:MAG TPA: hypothetical protein VLE53_14050 [Gemmatimonadaceae bacterium]|nr:hypothetical protein [Gemmatimonadaceae bacterium]
MKRILMISSLAVACGLTLPTLASAQDTVRRGGEVARTPSYATLMSALASTQRTAEQIKGLTTINETDVRVVDVKDFVTTTNESEFNDAIGRHQAELDSLRAAIEANPTLSKALADHKAMAGGLMTDTTARTDTTMQQPPATMGAAKDVVAAEVLDDGEIVLYVHRKY